MPTARFLNPALFFLPLLDLVKGFQILTVFGAIRCAFHANEVIKAGKISGGGADKLPYLVFPDLGERYSGCIRVNIYVENILTKQNLFL